MKSEELFARLRLMEDAIGAAVGCAAVAPPPMPPRTGTGCAVSSLERSLVSICQPTQPSKTGGQIIAIHHPCISYTPLSPAGGLKHSKLSPFQQQEILSRIDNLEAQVRSMVGLVVLQAWLAQRVRWRNRYEKYAIEVLRSCFCCRAAPPLDNPRQETRHSQPC